MWRIPYYQWAKFGLRTSWVLLSSTLAHFLTKSSPPTQAAHQAFQAEIPGDYPDPGANKIGDHFYLVATGGGPKGGRRKKRHEKSPWTVLKGNQRFRWFSGCIGFVFSCHCYRFLMLLWFFLLLLVLLLLLLLLLFFIFFFFFSLSFFVLLLLWLLLRMLVLLLVVAAVVGMVWVVWAVVVKVLVLYSFSAMHVLYLLGRRGSLIRWNLISSKQYITI